MSSGGHWAFELPLLPLEGGPLLPCCQLQLAGDEDSAVGLVAEHALRHHSIYVAAFAVKRDGGTSAGGGAWKTPHGPLCSFGCVARIAQLSHSQLGAEDGHASKRYTLVLQGLLRCELQELTFKQDISLCTVHVLRPVVPSTNQRASIRKQLHGLLLQYIRKLREQAPELQPRLEKLQESLKHASLELLCYMAAAISVAGPDLRQQLLDAEDLATGAQLISAFLSDKLKINEMLELPDLQAIHVPQPPKNPQRQLIAARSGPRPRFTNGGDEDGGEDGHDLLELEQRIESASMPDEAKQVVERELKRLKRLQPVHPEYHVIRSYLECMADLPWSTTTPELLDIPQARAKLDEDHFGLERVKKRITEFLAVVALRKTTSGSILCLVGPPGVGKTSLGKSVARAIGRKFARVALGGVHDEAEIRGHRRTYIGAMPGKIIQAMRRVGVANPVILLDEVDKVGHERFKGDPAAALLEVLDPEQNHTFTDHYVDVPFDLSRVLFICTANQVELIPAPLLDRMEVVELPGYTSEEKLRIAEQYLIPKQLQRCGLTSAHIAFPRDVLVSLATEYTREAGVRQLERTIGSLCRHVAVDVASKGQQHHEGACVEVSRELLEEVLGPPKFHPESAQQHVTAGVATGMAVTPAGGELLFVECARLPGNGKVTITGQLGDVMQESARIALSWLRSRAAAAAAVVTSQPEHARDGSRIDSLLAAPGLLERICNSDVHIHVPAGAIPKDGPSAGVAIVAALVSLFTEQCVDPSSSMTGEITLRGLVLPVGGVKDKVLAAHRGGIKRVLLPERNRRDLRDLPEDVLADLTFVFVDDVDQVLATVLLPTPKNAGESQRLQQPSAAAKDPQRSLRSFL